MLEHNHELSSYLVADALVPKIKLKWNQVNPKLVIIRDESIRIKIIRDVKFCQKIKSHKVSKKQKELFLRKLETLFDILHCKCPILACTSGPCYSVCPRVHIDCK